MAPEETDEAAYQAEWLPFTPRGSRKRGIGLRANDKISDIMGLSQELQITEDLIARQPPEAQAIIRLLLAEITELDARLNKTPRNSSLPPSTEHPNALPTSEIRATT